MRLIKVCVSPTDIRYINPRAIKTIWVQDNRNNFYVAADMMGDKDDCWQRLSPNYLLKEIALAVAEEIAKFLTESHGNRKLLEIRGQEIQVCVG